MLRSSLYCKVKTAIGGSSLVTLTLLACFVPTIGWISLQGIAGSDSPFPDPTPTIDRLAIPVLPEHPTQLEVGQYIYYYHCMVCHGDRGQGLTDEWRAVWETDHQNCWARGCHGNRQNDAFNIPTIIPAIMGGPTILGVQTAQDLYEYLKTTHPPQKPGTLTDDEYWAVTAFLFKENSRLPVGTVLGPASSTNWPLFALLAGIMVIMAVWAALLARRKLNSDRVTG